MQRFEESSSHESLIMVSTNYLHLPFDFLELSKLDKTVKCFLSQHNLEIEISSLRSFLICPAPIIKKLRFLSFPYYRLDLVDFLFVFFKISSHFRPTLKYFKTESISKMEEGKRFLFILSFRAHCMKSQSLEILLNEKVISLHLLALRSRVYVLKTSEKLNPSLEVFFLQVLVLSLSNLERNLSLLFRKESVPLELGECLENNEFFSLLF